MRTPTVVLAVSLVLASVTACGSTSSPLATNPAADSRPPATSTTESPASVPTPSATPSTPHSSLEPESTQPSSTAGSMPADATALVGPTWVLDGTFTVGGLRPLPTAGAATSSSPTAHTARPASLVFAADGSVKVDTGCNTGGGNVIVDADTPAAIKIDGLVLTAMACTDERVQAVEELMRSVLERPVAWSVNGSELSLIPTTMSDSGLHFTAVTS